MSGACPEGWTTIRLSIPGITGSPAIICSDCKEALMAWWELSNNGADHRG